MNASLELQPVHCVSHGELNWQCCKKPSVDAICQQVWLRQHKPFAFIAAALVSVITERGVVMFAA